MLNRIIKTQKTSKLNKEKPNLIVILTALSYGLAIGTFFMWLPIFVFIKQFDIFSITTWLEIILGIILGFLGFLCGAFIINYFENFKISGVKMLIGAIIFCLISPINLLMNVFSYVLFILFFIIMSLIYILHCFFDKSFKDQLKKLKRITLLVLVFLQLLGIIIGIAWIIEYTTEIQGDIPSINYSTIQLSNSSSMLTIRDSFPYDSERTLHVYGGHESKIRVVNGSGIYKTEIASKLEYDPENKIVSTKIDNEVFSATPENNYTMIIPIEFDDGNRDIITFNMYVKHVEYPYLTILLISFSPGILLIILLILDRLIVKKK